MSIFCKKLLSMPSTERLFSQMVSVMTQQFQNKVTIPEPVRVTVREHKFGVQYLRDKNTGEKIYTTKHLKFSKCGGRDHDGKRIYKQRGGGHKKNFRMIDTKRFGQPDGTPLFERVKRIEYDPCRTARIALVASENHKRYILASEKMKAGDLIKTATEIPTMTVKAEEGDSHPVGALPIGTLVHNVEIFEGRGGMYAKAAGTCCILVRKVDDSCVLKLPSQREIQVSRKCMVTVGKVSNVDHNKRKLGKAGRSRWLGIRPKSGLWQRKTGRFGRKIRPPKPVIKFEKSENRGSAFSS